jgi:protein-L-isoaspartate(D-aspartate) O-methyltransferase
MLRQDLQQRGIRDRRVLAAMGAVPRERFVPAGLVGEAYADHALPLGGGQTISQPFIVGLIAQALHLTAHETVLEVGAGSGYMAAVLARLANWVVAIEVRPDLAASASSRLDDLGLHHVDVHVGDGTAGWPEDAPFDAIVVSAAAPTVPASLLEQLAPGGRLVMPIGAPEGVQRLTLLLLRDGELQRQSLCRCKFVPLIGSN